MTDSKGSETPLENAVSVADATPETSAKKTVQEKKTASDGTKKQARRGASDKTATGTQAKKAVTAKDAATDKQTAAATAKASGAKRPSAPSVASGEKNATAAKASAEDTSAQGSETKSIAEKAASSKRSGSSVAVKAAKVPVPKSAAKKKASPETAVAAPQKAAPVKKEKTAGLAKSAVITAAKAAPTTESAQTNAEPLADGTGAASTTPPAPGKAPRAARKPQSKAKNTRSSRSAGVKESVPAPEAAAEKRQDTQAAPTEIDLVSSLPPFYAPQNLAVSTQTEHGKAPSPFSVVPPEQGAPSAEGVAILEEASDEKNRDKPSPRPEPSGKEAAEAAEPVAEAVAVETAGTEGEAAASAEAPASEKKRRSRGRGRRGRKKNGEEAAAPQVEASGEETLERDSDDALDDDDTPSAKIPKTGEGREELEAPGKTGRRKMFVSVLPGEQVEVAIAEEGQVREYYVEMLHQAKTKGNIYKATIHNVDANLQAVFVNYGTVKNGFLQIDEIHPEYYNVPHDLNKGRKYPPIQKVLKTGQELLVQVVKEPAGTKGAFLTTYLSLPGRYLVLTPGREQIGVSRKVEQDGERSRLREMLEGLSPGPGLGVIVRTVSMGTSKTNLQRDLQYLKRLWKDVRKRGTEEKAPNLIYQEMDLTTRATRDYLTDDITEVWIDDAETYKALTDLAGVLFPRKQNLVRLHKDVSLSLFERFNIQRQIDQIHSREVSLPSGGQLVIDPTEALTAIDINSGRSSGKNNFEDMAYRTNMEAAKMIPLQLRLRDIGGQVVADFIEMRDKAHWREVEKTLRAGMKEDRARYDVGKIGPFGMLEIVRQRLGSSAISISTEICPFCKGTGVRRNAEWRSQQALREIQRELRVALEEQRSEVSYAAEPDLALHLLNHKRERLLEMERNSGIRVEIIFKHNDI